MKNSIVIVLKKTLGLVSLSAAFVNLSSANAADVHKSDLLQQCRNECLSSHEERLNEFVKKSLAFKIQKEHKKAYDIEFEESEKAASQCLADCEKEYPKGFPEIIAKPDRKKGFFESSGDD